MNFLFSAGVTHVGGDMFQSIPSGDAIFMKVSLSLFTFFPFPIFLKQQPPFEATEIGHSVLAP